MTALATSGRFDRAQMLRLANWLAVAVAVALPWSTSATSICIVAWLLALLPALNFAAVRREIMTPAGGLPVLLWCLGALGMLWADVDWTARFAGLGGFHRLLVIPVLLAQFRRSEHGDLVVLGYVVSSTAVLATSYLFTAAPELNWHSSVAGIAAHDDIFQTSSFLICGFGLLGYAIIAARQRRWRAATGCGALAVLFLANFGVVVISRSALVVAPVLALLLGWRLFRWRGLLAAVVAAAAVGAIFWVGSASLRDRIAVSLVEMRDYRGSNAATSLGMHAAFLEESIGIIAAAPLIGHGTGSIAEQFRRITAGHSGATGVATVNPHNQTFAVAIQLGIGGALVLWAMWIAHFLLFRGPGFATWAGTAVVTENIVSSVAHSHLFDFGHGWIYVFGVGVLGGMKLRERAGAGGSVDDGAVADKASPADTR